MNEVTCFLSLKYYLPEVA